MGGEISDLHCSFTALTNVKSFTVLLKFNLFEVGIKQFFLLSDWFYCAFTVTETGSTLTLGSLSKSLRLVLLRLPWPKRSGGSTSRWSAKFYQSEIQRRQKHKLRSLKSLLFRFSLKERWPLSIVCMYVYMYVYVIGHSPLGLFRNNVNKQW